MSVNETCEFDYADRVRTDGYRVYNLVYSIVVIAVVTVSLVAWLYYRDLPRLAKRSPILVFIAAIGVILELLSGPLWRYDKTLFAEDCTLDNYFYFVCMPTTLWPLMVRLVLWANKIKLNFAIAGEAGALGVKKIDLKSPRLSRKVFLASKRFSLILTVAVLLPYYLFTFLLLDFVVCSECDLYYTISLAIFLSTIALLMILGGYITWAYRNGPDNTSIRKETNKVLLVCSVIGLAGFIFSVADVGGFQSSSPQSFDWIFYAINPTYASDDDRRSKSNDQLEEILATGRGKQIFELFLATDLSVENILFYNAVAQWKAEFREGSDVTRTQAKRISRKYLNSRSYLEINCSDRARQAVMEVLDDDNAVIEVTLFDKVQHEIARLMANDSVPRFKRSNFFLLFKGEIRPEDIPWLEFTGYSMQTVLRKTDRDSALTSVSQFAKAPGANKTLGRSFRKKKEESDVDEGQTAKLESIL